MLCCFYAWIDNHQLLLASLTAVVLVYFLVKRFYSARMCPSSARLDGKTVLITGASSGLGKATAIELAKRGARLLLACRSLSLGEAAATEIRDKTGNGNIKVYVLDLASLKSVRQCAAEVIENEARLDVLVNNAGVISASRQLSEDGFELTLAVNHIGHFLLCHLLLGLLRQSAPSRILNITSMGYKFGRINFDDLQKEKTYSWVSAYTQSKLANVLHCKELSRRLQGSNEITVNCVHPGVSVTSLMRDFEVFPLVLLKYALDGLQVLPTLEEIAQTTVYCAVAGELEGVSGKYFTYCREEPLLPLATDETAKKLWEVTERLVGLESS